MRCVVQRVAQAQVDVDEKCIAKINHGILALLGVEIDDTAEDLDYIVRKLIGLRIFDDDDGKMNLDIKAVSGSILLVSQFTLLGDARKGKRPSYIRAAQPAEAIRFYQDAIDRIREEGVPCQGGKFQANMMVSLQNDGPVTILLDSRKGF